MKKLTVLLFAATMLVFAGCKKEEVKPNTPTPGPQPQQEDPDQPGLYSPSAKIATVTVDDVLSEVWNWDAEGRLTGVDDADGNEQVGFTYDDQSRVSTMTINGDEQLSGTMSVSYNGTLIKRLSLSSGGVEVLGADVKYDGNKVSKATLTVGDNMVLDMFDSILAQYLGEMGGDSATTIPSMELDTVSGSINFSWAGDNVNLTVMKINAELKTTIGTIVSLVPDMSVFGTLGTLVQMVAQSNPDLPVYIEVAMTDSADFTYNTTYINPMRHYMRQMITMDENFPRFEIATLTKNPVDVEHHLRTAVVKLKAAIMSTNPTELFSQEMPIPESYMSYTYATTRSDMRPESVTSSDYHVKTFTYKANK